MRKLKRVPVFAAFVLILVVLGTARGAETPTVTPVERLAGLARLWGLIKFCHPGLAISGIDWDAALIRAIPEVKAAKTVEDYRGALERLCLVLGDPATRVDIPAPPAGEPETAVNPLADDSPQPQPHIEWTKDGIAVLAANDYDQFSDKTNTFIKMFADFQRVFGEAAKAPAVMIDLRNLKGKPSFLLELTVPRFLPLLLPNDVILPPQRFMSHSGYPSQRESTYAYHSDLTVRSGGVIRGQAARPDAQARRGPIVILINKTSANFYALLTGLQESRSAIVIQEGESSGSTGVTTKMLDLPEGIQATVRCAEILRRDGGADFRPDLSVPANAAETGLEILRGERKLETQKLRPPQASLSPGAFTVVEKAYPEMSFPDENYRLLGLFRFWNIINFFYPYKDLMDRPWNDALTQFIPKMAAAKDALEYSLTVAELVSYIQDSHGTISSPLYAEYLGTNSPPVRVDLIEGLTVVTSIKDPAIKKRGLEIGDIVLSVDGEAVGPRRERMARLLPASTEARLQNRVDTVLLSGKADSRLMLEVRKTKGKTVAVELVRSLQGPAPRSEPSQLPVFAVLKEGFGYIDLSRLREADVDPALESVKDSPGLILDMRGYPVGGNLLLGQRLARRTTSFARLQFPEYDGSSGSFSTREELQSIDPAGGRTYAGKIVVLIGSATQSAAEHTCLILESVADVTFIGSHSSGADGNITYTCLPGNVAVSFSGMGVRHADGRQLQRKGIQPDIHVEPTIAGIVAGRDEVLEAAIGFLQKPVAPAREF